VVKFLTTLYCYYVSSKVFSSYKLPFFSASKKTTAGPDNKINDAARS
jgi:hypothetical protein